MYLIQNITNDPFQKQTVVLSDGSALTITMLFRPMQIGWFFDSLVHGSFTINGMRVVNSPNMLQQWRNLLSFGLACYSTANREPSLQDDFASGASKLYVLTADEVAQYTTFLESGSASG